MDCGSTRCKADIVTATLWNHIQLMDFTKREISWQDKIPLFLKDTSSDSSLSILEQQHPRIIIYSILIVFNFLLSWTCGVPYLISPYSYLNIKMRL